MHAFIYMQENGCARKFSPGRLGVLTTELYQSRQYQRGHKNSVDLCSDFVLFLVGRVCIVLTKTLVFTRPRVFYTEKTSFAEGDEFGMESGVKGKRMGIVSGYSG